MSYWLMGNFLEEASKFIGPAIGAALAIVVMWLRSRAVQANRKASIEALKTKLGDMTTDEVVNRLNDLLRR